MLLFSSCNLSNPSSSCSTNSMTLISNNEPTSSTQVTTSSAQMDAFNEGYAYDGNYHWQNVTTKHDKKENYSLHNYDGGKCVVCGYIEHSVEHLTFKEIDMNSYAIEKCDNNALDITIPWVYENKYIVSILEKSFANCTNLVNVVIPSSVTKIEAGVFNGCSALTSVYIPHSVLNISGSIFDGTSSLTVFCEDNHQPNGWKTNWSKSIAHVIWGYKGEKGVENGLSYALCENENSKFYKIYAFDESSDAIEIPSSINGIPVTTINDSAFEKCFSLKSVIISSGITNIGKIAFASCISLIDISIPNTVSYIGDGAFSQCKALPSILIPSSITQINSYTFNGCESLKNVTISENVSYIGEYAFYCCDTLPSILIPSKLNEIGENAFFGCSALKDVFLSSSLKYLRNYSFSFCDSLSQIIIPKSVVILEAQTFFEGNPDLIVYCEVESQPSGWDIGWSANVKEVIWGYKIEG